MIAKAHRKAVTCRYSCPVEECDVMVFILYDPQTNNEEITGYTCEREGKCDISLYDPCPLYVELIEKRGVHGKSTVQR